MSTASKASGVKFEVGDKVRRTERTSSWIIENGRYPRDQVFTISGFISAFTITLGECAGYWDLRNFEAVTTSTPRPAVVKDVYTTIGYLGTTTAFQLPTDSAKRKDIPLASGCLDYFPAALAAVAECSQKGNDQHNPGEPLHHARGKSTDHADCIVRHLLDRGSFDTDGTRHSAKAAWRSLALLQMELEAAGAPKARGAK